MSSGDLLAQAQAALAQAERERVVTKAAHRVEIAEADEEIRRLRNAVSALTAKPRRSAAVQAGPKALAAIRSVLADGPMPQNRIVRETGLNDGTVSYGLRALVASGEIEATGGWVDGSREFRARKTRTRAA